MHIRTNLSSGKSGSVLAMTMVLGAIMLVTVASYYSLLSNEHTMVAESQAWNTALPLAEAGIEEGLAQLNVKFGLSNWMTSAQANFGTPSGGVYGPRTCTLSNGSYSVIIITDTNPYPTIIATGYTRVPIVGRSIARAVKVTTTAFRLWNGAVAARDDIDMNGNNIMVDSYDSADPYHSYLGMYDPLTRLAGGDVASSGGVINVGNADIYGHVRTTPWGSVSVGPQGRVGDLPSVWNGSGIQSGWYIKDYNAVFPDAADPFAPSAAFAVAPNGSGTNTYVLTSGNWISTGNLLIKSGENLRITGNVTLWVQGSFTMQSQTGSFVIIDPGCTLKIYVGTQSGPSVSCTFTTVNNSGNAYNFQYYGLPSNTSLSWGGNATYVGTVYAPQADYTLGGGGSTVYDYQGSCVVKSVKMNGHFSIHYDENLKRNGPPSGYTITSWEEL